MAATTIVLMLLVLVLGEGAGDRITLILPGTFLVVGWIVLRRDPTHVEGRLVLGSGLAWGFALTAPVEGSWVVPVGMMCTHLLQRYPDGRLPSPRWRWFGHACTVMIVVLTILVTTASEVREQGGLNPLYVPWTNDLAVLVVFLPVCMIVSFISVFVRARRASVVERTQIRWLSMAAVAVVCIYVITLAASFGYDALHDIDSDSSSFFAPMYPWWLQTLQFIALFSFMLIPLAFGIAITRYHLYDIDRIVSRTTSYVIVTALVLATYVVVVTVVLRVLPDSSSLAVATATLAAAAIARPAVRRVQGVVDRRFDRERYDHVRTVEDFSAEIRHLVDPTQVTQALLEAVRPALQPATAALWVETPR